MIYISGKITGTDDFMERFALKENMLILRGCKVVNPAKVNAKLPELTWKQCMIMSLTMLSMCDSIFMMTGWETSPGAKIEHEYAVKHGYRIVYENEARL